MARTKEGVRKGDSGQQKAGGKEEHVINENSGYKGPEAEVGLLVGGAPPHRDIHGTKVNSWFQERHTLLPTRTCSLSCRQILNVMGHQCAAAWN